MEACLRTIPDFVDRHPLDDPSAFQATVPISTKELPLTLSWIED
jgi:hypothetical protein